MPSYSHATLAGNLSRDPELKYTPQGTAIVNFSVAVNKRRKNEAGEQVSVGHFFECKAFEKTAENIAKFFKKGSGILVAGNLEQETWEDKETKAKRSKVVVLVRDFSFIDKAPEGGAGEAPASQPQGAATAPSKTARQVAAANRPAGEAVQAPEDDDSVPF